MIRVIGKHLKAYKKNYLDRRKAEPRKVRIKKNSDWRRRWMPFIKYDHDFDGIFFIELIVHKLHIMLDYYDHGKYCHQVDESRLEIVKSLKEACKLGDMILEDAFYDPVYKFMEEHTHINEIPYSDGNVQISIVWDSKENEQQYKEISRKCEASKKKIINHFFNYIKENYDRWWD